MIFIILAQLVFN